MTARGIFLADGPSDLPLADHLQTLCSQLGADVQLTPIDPRLLRGRRTVAARLRFLELQGAQFDIAFIHRDAEVRDTSHRYEEVADGVRAAALVCPVVPVVPIRMTEAWLLLDEAAIRRVAGKPQGRTPLNLPKIAEVESLVDPKSRLAETLLLASGATGRRRDRFRRDFGEHRALLLRRLDPSGDINRLRAWQKLKEDIQAAVDLL